MVLPVDYLRSHISRSATSILIILCNSNPSYTHIGNPKISLLINDQILWLDIPMDNIISMDILQSQYNTAYEEFDDMLWKSPMFSSMVTKISTWH